MSNHTPEPWVWKEGTPYIVKEWNGRRVVIARVILPDWHENSDKASEEAGANARLIVAAPALLAAAEAALPYLRQPDSYTMHDFFLMENKLEAAITAAKGNTPAV